MIRYLTILDRALIEINHALNTFIKSDDSSPVEANPADQVTLEVKSDEELLTEPERKHVIGLMRINHTGEVCAQALYRGQAFFARNQLTRNHLWKAAQEENDHLLWCQKRIEDLGGRTSFFNLFWYGASFQIGLTASFLGDDWSYGFVVATERQVEKHLDEHLEKLPSQDLKSRVILEKMREDEIRHAQNAQMRGARELPKPVKCLMKLQSKVMTSLTYWI